METIETIRTGPVAVITLQRGKVNAINETMVLELTRRLEALEQDAFVRAIVVTGRGRFFSFGFDIPELLAYRKEDFIRYLGAFTNLYTRIFLSPKPVIAALNGHTIAGGCMLALACDRRIMSRGTGKIALNEITFGASVFAGSVEILRYCVGSRRAESILYSGRMHQADEALAIGLVDQLATPEHLMQAAGEWARRLGEQDPVAFRSIKRLLRAPIARRMRPEEDASIKEFADIWYSDATWGRLKKITIR